MKEALKAAVVKSVCISNSAAAHRAYNGLKTYACRNPGFERYLSFNRGLLILQE